MAIRTQVPTVELAERIVENYRVKINYKFATIIVTIYDNEIDEVKVVKSHANGLTTDEKLTNYYLSDYDKVAFLSGYEPLARKALEKYINYIERGVGKLKPLLDNAE